MLRFGRIFLREELDALAEASDRSRAWIVKEAIETYLIQRRQYVAELKAARQSALTGPLHSAASVFRWMDSWGGENPLPKPEPDTLPDRKA